MKRIICMIFVVLLVLTCCVVCANASSPKISADTVQKITETPDGEKLEVLVWLNVQVPSADEIRKMAQTELGDEWWMANWGSNPSMEAVQEFLAVYNRIASELESAENQKFIQKAGIPEEDIVYISTKAPMLLLNADAQTIYRLAEMTEVQSISYEGDRQTEEPVETPLLFYKTQFEDYIKKNCSPAELLSYDELYYHKDSDGAADWVLVYAETNMEQPLYLNTIIGNRVIRRSCYGVPFNVDYGIYDVKSGKFVDVDSAVLQGYDDFNRIFDEFGGGRLLGDIDGDDTLSVVDATLIRRCEVKVRDYPDDDEISMNNDFGDWTYSVKYYSDFNRDGDRSILDVTCMQRYLAHMNYPIG